MSQPINADQTRIAIIGMAGRFPGARDISEFWRNLHAGVESVKRLTDDQLRGAGAEPEDLRNPAYVKAASVLDDIDLFDAAFFGLSPKDAAIMDPQHRLFLECAWHALEDAGWAIDQFDGRIGVYAGSGMNTYLIHNLLANRKLVSESGLFLLKQTGNDKDVLATRVSYQLNLTGPSLAVQTACSSSLVAVHLASQSLLNGECDMALAGGVTVEIPHGRGYLYREGEILSRDGHCRPFDAESSGTIFGSGVGIVVLRRLADALRDGDTISAIIRGTAINNDGARKVGFLAPSVAGQAEVIAEALAAAGVEADSISYVEAHGTGTRVGDPIEIEALTRAFRTSTNRRGFCAVGALKSNVGHLDAAAGVAGLIKTVLALKNRQIPATLNFGRPNPLIDFAESPFFVANELTDWTTEGGLRRAGVTSLGIGGTNAHAVLEEAPPAEAPGPSRNYELLTISAKSAPALDAMSRNLADYLEHTHSPLGDVAFTSHLGRTALPHRRSIVCRNAQEAAEIVYRHDPALVTGTASESEPPVVFLFPGQGAQYAGMAGALFETEPAFRALIRHCCEFLRPYLGIDLRSVIFAATNGPADEASPLTQTHITQPALFVIEYALAQLWISLGICPAAMIGHSIGEFAAACVAGVYSLEDTLRIVAERGRLMQSLPRGLMTAIAAPEDQVNQLLDERCAIASVNAPDQCVAAGPSEAIEALEAELARRQLPHQRLQVSHAFHSPMMEPILEPFAEFVSGFQARPATMRWVSSVTGTWMSPLEAGEPAYWAGQLRKTVRYAQGVSTLLKQSATIFLEVGPGHTLTSLIERHPDFSSHVRTVRTLPSARQQESDEATFLHALGTLWVSGLSIDWRRYHRGERRHRVALPGYPFERQRFWIEPDPPIFAAASPGTSTTSPAVDTGPQLFRPVWKGLDLQAAAEHANSATGPWLIFADTQGLGDRAASLLRDRGEQVTVVRAGNGLARVARDEFQIAGDRGADYEHLVAALRADDRLPRRILHLWNIVDSTPVRDKLDELDQMMVASFWSIFFLTQALAPELGTEADCRWGIISNSLAAPEGELIERPERAMLAGPCGVIPKELPDLQLQHIDVVMPTGSVALNGNRDHALGEVAYQIIGEIDATSGDSPVAYRRGRRFVRTHEALAQTQEPIRLPDGGVHVITGGLGGIGLALAETIARSPKARLVLLSRQVLPARAEWPQLIADGGSLAATLRKIESLERTGVQVMTISADVTDEGAMASALGAIHERFGPVTGVIHAAGTIADEPLLSKSAASAAMVLAPKVRGTLVLECTFGHEKLEYFILCSSVSSILAPAGQVDYAAANAFLDAFAQAKSSSASYPVIALQFPRWSDVGMAAQRPAIADEVARTELTISNDGTGNERVTELTLDLANDWIVREHRLRAGAGLFPGTGYVEMILNAARELIPAERIVIRDLQFKRPLAAAPGEPRRVRTRLSRSGSEYVFTASAQTGNGWSECASARLTPEESLKKAGADLAAIRRRCTDRSMVFTHRQNRLQESIFDFGPRWHALERIDFGEKAALATVELAPEFIGDLDNYKVHPALLDMATGAALFLIPGYENSSSAYVPMGYGRIKVWGPLPARCYGHLRQRGDLSKDSSVAVFDAEILDEKGNVLIEIGEFTVRRIEDGLKLATQAAPALPAGTDGQANHHHGTPDQITSIEGVATFRRVLEGAYAANVLAFPSDFSVFAPAFRRRGEVARAARATGVGDTMRDEVETTVAQWWRELLGAQQLTPQSDFFQLGGQSLTAVRLFVKIKKTYGIQLSPATIYEARTIEKLARYVRNRGSRELATNSTLVPIRSEGSRPPLFLFPDMTGTVIGFDTLVRRLPDDFPVYGAESTWFTSAEIPLRLEEMAACHLEGIRALQQHGPYFLLGYSFGGLMAFEVAQQLVAAGETIGMLGMLDTWQLGHIRHLDTIHRRSQKFARRARKAMVHLGRLLAGPNRLLYLQDHIVGRFRRQLESSMFGAIVSHYMRTGRPLPRFLRAPSQINMFAAQRYVTQPYEGRITMFRATQGIALDDPRYGESLGWQNIAQDGVHVCEVPGTHREMLQEPNVQLLAREVAAAYMNSGSRYERFEELTGTTEAVAG